MPKSTYDQVLEIDSQLKNLFSILGWTQNPDERKFILSELQKLNTLRVKVMEPKAYSYMLMLLGEDI